MASTIVVSLAKQNGSFGIRLSEQGVVTGYGIAGGAAEAAGLPVGARIVAVQGVAVGGKKEVVAQLKAAGEDGVVDLSCVLPMEKLLAEAARLEALREKEQGELLRMDKDKAVRARHLQIEARRRSEMEQQRKLRREQEDRYHEMVDAQRSKALDHAQRLKEQRIEREKATQEKRQRREAKMAAVADKMQKEEEELQKKEVELNSKFATMSMRAGSPMGGTMSTPRGGAGGRGSPRRMASPRMLRMSSPGRRGSVGSGAGSPLGRPSTASGKAEAIASRRMEEEMAALERRIQREKERIDRIQKEKASRREAAKKLREESKAKSMMAREGGEGGDDLDETTLGAEDMGGGAGGGSQSEESKSVSKQRSKRRAGSTTPRNRIARRTVPAPPELTGEEAARLGFIKKQRCAVCEREYIKDNLPAVVSYRAVERLRETWCEQFGTVMRKDARYAAATKLYDQVRVCVFCFQFFDPDHEER